MRACARSSSSASRAPSSARSRGASGAASCCRADASSPTSGPAAGHRSTRGPRSSTTRWAPSASSPDPVAPSCRRPVRCETTPRSHISPSGDGCCARCERACRGVPGTFSGMRAIAGDVVITLRRVNINRPRLLAASLAIAVVVSVVGGYVVESHGRRLRRRRRRRARRSAGSHPPERASPRSSPIPRVTSFPTRCSVDRDGNDVSSRSLLGDRPLVINFWFSTCIPCERELSDFAEVDAEVSRPGPLHRRQPARLGPDDGALRRRTRGRVRTAPRRGRRTAPALGVTFFPYTRLRHLEWRDRRSDRCPRRRRLA